MGDKVVTEYRVPPWLRSMSREVAVSFLDSLLANEVSVPMFKVEYGSKRFKNFSLSLSKKLELKESHVRFLEEIKRLLLLAGVRTTPNVREDAHTELVRKDGTKTRAFRIFICTDLLNVIAFNRVFELRYCRSKKNRIIRRIAEREEADANHKNWLLSNTCGTT